MPSVYVEDNKNRKQITLSFGEYASIIYHDIFDFPLNFEEVAKWSISEDYLFSLSPKPPNIHKIDYDNGYFYVGEGKLKIHKRTLRKQNTEEKMQLAYKAAYLLGLIPSILFIGLTGSLAMENSDQDSDIDFMIITKKNTLWASRALTLIVLNLFGIKTRRKGDKHQKDKICNNIWLEEDNLEWVEKNVFTAHEALQVKPLVNKDNTFRRFHSKNSWAKKYFPFTRSKNNSKEVTKNTKVIPKFIFWLMKIINYPLYRAQKAYMQNSITDETITQNKAIFHPLPLSNYIENQFVQLYTHESNV